MIILNNLLDEYDAMLERLVNHLKSSSHDTIRIKVICDKVNLRYEKLRIKLERKNRKKVLLTFVKQCKSWCNRCHKYYDKSTGPKCLEGKNGDKNEKKMQKITKTKKRESTLENILTKKYRHRISAWKNHTKEGDKAKKALDVGTTLAFAWSEQLTANNCKKKMGEFHRQCQI